MGSTLDMANGVGDHRGDAAMERQRKQAVRRRLGNIR
jgi:hypothetical protein